MGRPSYSNKTNSLPTAYPWGDLSDQDLLDLRLCDLKIQLNDTWIMGCVRQLNQELDRVGLRVRPHVWLSSEWFSPDGVPGIAIPFYLSHGRLMRLEKKQMLEVEGGSPQKCMKILRHEAGHCIDTAYRLHQRKQWKQFFGSYTTPYPDAYRPDPASHGFVLHLDWWYAQAHPAEDFAETFAVWLTPNSRWRQHYQTWPALRKLEYVDQLMDQIRGTPPKIRSRRQVEPVSQIQTTLRQHYDHKRQRHMDGWPELYDLDLHRLFSNDSKFRGRPTAASFLRQIHPQVRKIVSDWTGSHPYTIDHILRSMIGRCKELRLRLMLPEDHSRVQTMIMVTIKTLHFAQIGHHRIPI